ncbi:hypothetical protein Atai01_34320 [Amycolatopsis taiwanensis]|uniref:DUF3558 domain-containing protein n=1 Tax=Amycolatopsis taiwanensis TaxID=342230 RepID=A0A9W6R006_9PSEU|nr:hypothetical protein Atai01_34320 [Amycolatopsis taiwanensis]
MAGCGTDDTSQSGATVTPALADGVNTRCGQYLKPETVAAALGANTFADVNGQIENGAGSCLINISVTEVGYGPDSPRHSVAKVSLEILDFHDPSHGREPCDDASAHGATEAFTGPDGACGLYWEKPPEAFLVGGRVSAYIDEGGRMITVRIDGVDPTTVNQDRDHAFQLLADARAKASQR